MGLLDSLFNQDDPGNGVGGLLNYLQSPLYPSPLNKPADLQQPQYDPMGNYTGITPQAASPFGPLPQMSQPAPSQFAPPSAFTTGASPIAGIPSGAPAAPAPAAPQAAPPQMAAPAPQNNPINTMNIGGYQMPQFGSASDYTPQQAMLPPNAQPTQGQLPAPPQQTQSTPDSMGADRGAGFGDRLNAGFQNFANASGLLPALAGGISGLASGTRTDPVGMQQQSQSQTFKALVEAGMPKNVAMAAALNPKLLEQVAPGYFAKNEIVDGGTDPLTGKKTFVLKNSVDGTVQELNSRGGAAGGADIGSGQDVADRIAQAKARGATRDQLLQLVPASYRPYVDAVLQDKALPANMGRGAARMQVMGLAHAVDDKFNEEMIPTRVAMRKDFSGEGKNGMAIGSFNTVQHHIGQVSDAIEGLVKAGGGGDYPLINAGKLMLANNTGLDPKLRDAAETLKNKLNAAQHEVANAYNAGHISDSDRKTWEEIKASNLPADQLRQKLADFEELLAGKRDSLNHIYRTTFGEDAPAIDRKANEEVSAKVHSRLRNDSPAQLGLPSGWSVKVH